MFQEFQKQMNYSEDYLKCIEDCVNDLLTKSSDTQKPGMLLGKIQSGKTRTFLGIIALSFTKGFDAVIVLTKGTNALGTQTVKRIKNEFKVFVDRDEVAVFDAKQVPQLTEWTINESKQIIVCKKEDDNLKALKKLLFQDYEGALSKKRFLIIDDEADYSSISMTKKKGEIKSGTIWNLIDSIRFLLPKSAFLQVTATPYSLYLQPDNSEINGAIFQPTRPAFTHLVPVHDKYVGGDFYFRESQNPESIASDVHIPVDDEEMNCLSKEDGRKLKIENVLTAKSIKTFRSAIITFVAGAAVRRLKTNKSTRYSILIHVNIAKKGHSWQERILTELLQKLKNRDNEHVVKELFASAYENLKFSMIKAKEIMPEWSDFYDICLRLLTGVSTSVVNSDDDVNRLLNEDTGELQLTNPLNIFIGGSILDRGLTIPNVIGFFYGRSPKNFQQDTVLQHARMYGARSKDDLAVTRFYTTGRVYQIMSEIHEMDSALREAITNGQEHGVVFIGKDDKGKIRPCSPNKVMLSEILALKPHSTRVPFGFQTGYQSNIKKAIDEIDTLLKNMPDGEHLVDFELISNILKKIRSTFCFNRDEYPKDVPSVFEDEGYQWDVSSDIEAMKYASTHDETNKNQNKIWLVIRRDRDRKRKRENGRIENSPISGTGEGEIAKNLATDICSIILTRQLGKKDSGWMDAPFWWPVIRFPKEMKPMIFSSKILNS